ncbi:MULTISPECIES: LLM class flavin-dependent oxidoreductase [Sphingobacterium]|uniref:LLM class flavin-dependent oxidoreductase n=1 Tax=Sphingobacterium TaxID=28453 RepID=UPI00257A3E73|nr:MULTISPECIES: LLM class flavin-dependent oxidoreductase [Sphingobacterium]
MKLGILEFGVGYTIPNNFTDYIFEYAQKAEELGFNRFWLGEHYFSNASWYSPEILLALIAGLTNNIKVGCAGVLLGIHKPYEIAMQYKMLASLFPERIDLGLAKGSAPVQIIESLGIEHKGQYLDNITKLCSFFTDKKLALNMPPCSLIKPEIWGLTSGRNNFNHFAVQGLNCSVSLFHIPFETNIVNSLSIVRANIDQYRELYLKTWGKEPQINFTVAGLCEQSSFLAKKRWLSVKNKLELLIYNPILGSPTSIYDKIAFFQEHLNIEEIVFLNLEPDPNGKIKGITRLSKIY